jgi:hypothetical protein
MSDSPFFSIVIPTRNRAELLRYAIASALNQTFDDYEIVVSNNHSSDDTDAVVASMSHPRLRAIRPGAPLSMPEHWEYVLPFARGRYVTYLCDDDALAPNALALAAQSIAETSSDFVVSPYVPYVAPTWFDASRRNTLLLPRFTGESTVMQSAETLRAMFSCRDSVWAPRMLNSFGRAEVIVAARERAGGLFWMCPDFSFASCILTATKTWTLLDAPLRLFGVVPQSVGASMGYDGGRAQFSNFQKEMGGQSLFRRAPLKTSMTPNMICETLLITKERLPKETAGIEVDRASYFAENGRYIAMLEANGADMSAEKRALDEALAREPEEVRDGVAKLMGNVQRRRLRSRLLPLESPFRPLAFRLGIVGGMLVRGEKAGFDNIADAAAWIASHG